MAARKKLSQDRTQQLPVGIGTDAIIDGPGVRLWGYAAMSTFVGIVRTVGIAVGSLVAAYLAFMFVVGTLFGRTGSDSPLAAFLVVILGGLVFADIHASRPPPQPNDTAAA